ncbi:eCIS core domain-containing protein [Streptomyces sp. NPDC055722]
MFAARAAWSPGAVCGHGRPPWCATFSLRRGARWNRTPADLEAQFGCDFSRVRVHADATAAASADAVDGLAYTVGWDVVFAQVVTSPTRSKGGDCSLTNLPMWRSRARSRSARTSSCASANPVTRVSARPMPCRAARGRPRSRGTAARVWCGAGTASPAR